MILFELLATIGFVLTFLGVTNLLAQKIRGPARSGKYRALDRLTPRYVRIGPPLLLLGILGVAILR